MSVAAVCIQKSLPVRVLLGKFPESSTDSTERMKPTYTRQICSSWLFNKYM